MVEGLGALVNSYVRGIFLMMLLFVGLACLAAFTTTTPHWAQTPQNTSLSFAQSWPISTSNFSNQRVMEEAALYVPPVSAEQLQR